MSQIETLNGAQNIARVPGSDLDPIYAGGLDQIVCQKVVPAGPPRVQPPWDIRRERGNLAPVSLLGPEHYGLWITLQGRVPVENGILGIGEL